MLDVVCVQQKSVDLFLDGRRYVVLSNFGGLFLDDIQFLCGFVAVVFG